MLKYVLQLNLLHKTLEHEGSFAFKILSDFGKRQLTLFIPKLKYAPKISSLVHCVVSLIYNSTAFSGRTFSFNFLSLSFLVYL